MVFLLFTFFPLFLLITFHSQFIFYCLNQYLLLLLLILIFMDHTYLPSYCEDEELLVLPILLFEGLGILVFLFSDFQSFLYVLNLLLKLYLFILLRLINSIFYQFYSQFSFFIPKIILYKIPS